MKRAIFGAKTRLLMRHDRRAFEEMLRLERMTESEFRRFTADASTSIAVHAFDNSPFYRDLYSEAGFERDDVAEVENFARLPVVTKNRLREAGDAVLARNIPSARALISQTGGSTGSPLSVRNDAAAPTAAMWWRIYSWWNVHPADDMAFIYRQLRHGRDALLYKAQWWPSRHMHLDARAITESSMESFITEWQRVNPRLLVAYVEGATAVAAHLERTQRTLSTAAVSVTAAMLQPGQRELLERNFNAPVFDTYRSAEIPWIAAECAAHDGLHVAADQRRVEIVDADGVHVGADREGSVVVTDYSNEAFPLVRYEMGDRSRTVAGACACGRVFPRIAPVQGRIADVLLTPSGKRITGGLSGLFLDSPGAIRQMQIVQHSDLSVTLRFVPDEPGSAFEASAVAAGRLRALLDGEVSVNVEEVESIISTAGKARLVISEVSS